jgi:hypothetical protein
MRTGRACRSRRGSVSRAASSRATGIPGADAPPATAREPGLRRPAPDPARHGDGPLSPQPVSVAAGLGDQRAEVQRVALRRFAASPAPRPERGAALRPTGGGQHDADQYGTGLPRSWKLKPWWPRPGERRGAAVGWPAAGASATSCPCAHVSTASGDRRGGAHRRPYHAARPGASPAKTRRYAARARFSQPAARRWQVTVVARDDPVKSAPTVMACPPPAGTCPGRWPRASPPRRSTRWLTWSRWPSPGRAEPSRTGQRRALEIAAPRPDRRSGPSCLPSPALPHR